MKNLNKLPANNSVEIREKGTNKTSLEIKRVASTMRGKFESFMENTDWDSRLIFILVLLLALFGCNSTPQKDGENVPGVKVGKKEDKDDTSGVIAGKISFDQKSRELMRRIDKVDALNAGVKNIPKLKVDPNILADLAEGLAYFDMGIEITDAEKNRLKKELGIDEGSQVKK